MVINSFKVAGAIKNIDYGYDGPVKNIDAAGNASYKFMGALHNTSIAFLPRIWAENDKNNASDNNVICCLSNSEGVYVFDNEDIDKKKGNYMKITATYDGLDIQGKYEGDDEFVAAAVVMGTYNEGEFVEKYRYNINFSEGNHEYLVRCSTDYYWYSEKINAVKIITDAELRNTTLQLLEGD